MKFKNYVMALVMLFSAGLMAQESYGPTETGVMQGPIYVPSFAEQIQNGTFIPAEEDYKKLGMPKRKFGNNIVPGKGFPKEGTVNQLRQLQEQADQYRVMPPLQTFETTASTATPGDPTGAVGPNHYVAAWNTSFRIFDKSGNPLTNAASLSTLFPGNNAGDPIVFYDAAADRFVITEFDFSPNGFNVAVCQGPDPVNDGWYVYTTGFGTGAFPDYTKFSVWGDVYMVTANIGQSNRVFAIERNEMLNGDPSQFVGLPLPGIATFGFYSPQAFHTTDGNLAPAGTPVPIVYLQDDAWGGVTFDHLKVWSATIDWNNTSNSSMSSPQVINTAPFISVFDGGSFSNLPQPSGPDIDCMQATIMNQAQYRRFGTHNSVVFNFVEDTDPGPGNANELAGIRWYELRQTADGQPWTIFQEGTYISPAGGKHAFAGSMAMNSNGDIGLGYTTVSNSESVALYYTGRLASDPLNVMTVSEELIGQGSGNNNNLRYADYAHLTVDPTDNTFWHVSEYFNPNRRHLVGQFEISPPQPNDIGVLSIDEPNSGTLTNAEDITITIRNYGSNNITNPEVQYDINASGTPVVENFSGTIVAGTQETFTFATTADLSAPGSYVIDARTNLPGDSNPGNDAASKTVENGVQYCIPQATSGCNVDGIKKFVLNTIDADDGGDGCNTEPAGSPQGYADRTNLETTLSNQSGSNVYTLQAQQNWTGGPGVSRISVWIDFDDSGTFEVSERLISGEFFQAVGVLEDFTLTIPVGAALGPHRLRAKSIDASAAGDVLNPCSDFAFGEVQDYTVIIDDVLGADNPAIESAELIVTSLPNNQFKISMNTSFEGIAYIQVVNTLGQVVVFNNLAREETYNGFTYDLDMSYASSGVYIIQMGDQRSNSYQTAKIIVK